MKKKLFAVLNPFNRKSRLSLYMMRFSVLMFCLLSIQTLTAGVKAQNATIQVKSNNITLGELFKEIVKQTEYLCIYSQNDLNDKAMVNLKNKKAKVSVMLEEALKGKNMQWEMVNGYIILSKEGQENKFQSYKQAKALITGIVKDTEGNPIIGASVTSAANKSIGTITDMDGHFSLSDINNGDNILISFIGYKSTTVKAIAGKEMIITLSEDVQTLNEVIVVGFGTQKKVNLTGSVSQVKMDDVLGDRPVMNVAAALQGAMPGLMVSGASTPGQTKSFNIRGTLSINGGGPLVLIDNVEGDINMLNPDDIESVSVLKDAASSSIYGARAAGGVILVTTKRPEKATSFHLNYNFYQGFENSINRPEQAGLDKYLDAYIEAGYTKTYWAGNGDVTKWKEYLTQYRQDPSSIKTIGDGIYKDTDGRVYWLSENDLAGNTQNTGSISNHNISASGGTDKLRYRLSAGYNTENGPLITNKDTYTRKNISSFISADLLKWFTQEVTITYADSKKKMPQNIGNMNGFYSTRLVNYYPEGMMPGELIGSDVDLPTQTPANMVRYAPVSNTNTSVPRVFIKSILKPLPGWSISLEYTFDRKDVNYKFYSSRFDFSDVQLAKKSSTEAGQDYYEMQNETTKYNALNLYSNYEHTWGKHNFKAMVGFNQESSSYKLFYGKVLGQTVVGTPSFSGGTGQKTITDSYSEYAIRGGFGRLNYTFNDRYLLEVSGRYDGSSKFPKDNRFGFFPSVSAGWRLTQEEFMEWSKDWLDDFKLRASYGSIGNQNINPYQFTPSMSVAPSTVWLNNNDKINVINSPGLISSSFTWEKVKTIDVGFDLAMFKNRLQATFGWYSRITDGMLAAGIEIPSVVGATAPLQNIANMKTNGWEANITWRDVIGDFSYRVGLNVYDHKSKITKYNNESGLLSDYYVGQKLGEIWGYVADGYYTIDDFDLESAKQGSWKLKDGIVQVQGVSVQPGDMKYRDLDGNNIISSGSSTLTDPGDRKVIGNNTSRYQFGANFGISYKGFDLSAILQGTGKRDYWIGGASIFPFAGAGAGDAVFQPLYYNQTDYWTALSYDPADPNYMVAANPDAKIFRIYNQGNNVGYNTRYSNKYLQNASYLRIKNVTLGYSLPKALIQKILLSQAKVYVSAENLATFTSLPKGYDPETLYRGYPFYRTISFGVNLTF